MKCFYRGTMKEIAVRGITRKFEERIPATAPISVDSLADPSYLLLSHPEPQPSNIGKPGVSSFYMGRKTTPKHWIPNSTLPPIEGYFIDVYLGGIEVTPRDSPKLSSEQRERIRDEFTRQLRTTEGRDIMSGLTGEQLMALNIQTEIQATYRH